MLMTNRRLQLLEEVRWRPAGDPGGEGGEGGVREGRKGWREGGRGGSLFGVSFYLRFQASIAQGMDGGEMPKQPAGLSI